MFAAQTCIACRNRLQAQVGSGLLLFLNHEESPRTGVLPTVAEVAGRGGITRTAPAAGAADVPR